METLPLSELAAFIRRVFALNLPEAVWVSAELGQVNTSRGHTWLTLVEKSEQDDSIVAQLDAVVWASGLKRIRKTHSLKLVNGVFQEGMSVRLQVTASFHERFGLKLIVADIDPDYTLGSLEKRRQATLEALQAAGLLDRNAQLPLPVLPQRLAIISADTAAGLADFQRQLADNPYGYIFHTDLYPAAMQGMQTGDEVMARLRQIARRSHEYDAIVLVRGGGGKTDLAAFNEYAICEALADAPLPVLAGIGHEIDDTVADRVVHRSLKTPTAVAVFLIEQLSQLEARTLHLGRAIATTAEQLRSQEVRTQLQYASQLQQTAAASLQASHLRTAALTEEVQRAARLALKTAETKLDHQKDLLDALRPETTLARGYALVSQNGRLITAPGEVQKGEVSVRLRDGRIRLRQV
ncbi:Exodeoxyribonuclease 7 large subunit [Neolewinella maritima]|uniref:Exodeoxyribonuclease 7 large subunit n=1 Tax=Neolewinella maritima TaxID=1383882 RepID=A0ABN8F5B4_9BACT|nr:exodeoxyribonuclease VII large subunit [Neolewinella maritima]CAH1000142.1 Exodeoxyribonuclease 7 large subunit [Neolewinella maritima]